MERSSIVVIALSVFFALAILFTARRLRTHERHTFSWLLICAGIIALAVWREGIHAIAQTMGIYYPPAALFFIACGVLLWMVYRLSLQVAEQRERIKKLAQEVALLSSAKRAGEATGEAREKDAA